MSVQERKLTAREWEVLMMEGCIGIASDLVSCEPKHKKYTASPAMKCSNCQKYGK